MVFYDNGIRNAIIANFSSIRFQNRCGIMGKLSSSERKIKITIRKRFLIIWRTYDQQELDWLEEENGILRGYEFKWNENRKAKFLGALPKDIQMRVLK
jgi:hypothetical protein